MGLALEVVAGFVTAPSTTFTAWTIGAGSSLTIRNAPFGSRIRLLQAWADNQAAGTLRIRSPKLHDNVQGIRLDVTASDVKPLLPYGYQQQLIPQDTLIAEQTGSATAGDIESGAFLVFYEDLPGSAARLLSAEQVMERMVNLVSVENTLALGTAGGFSGEEAVNAEFDLLKANTDYALLGYLVDTECLLVGWRGADSGNLRVAGPGDELGRDVTASWFMDLARNFHLPLVPVFNSANRAGILVDGVQDENGTDATVTTILAELGPAPR
jgi:hypothetical protein